MDFELILLFFAVCVCVVDASCSDDEFTCANGQCIQKRWACDRDIDCGDGSDEGAHCPPITCSPEEENSCGNGKCVPTKWWCDGEEDCPDGLDEKVHNLI